MNELEQEAYIFAAIFTLSNKLQVLGDRFDPNITIKQWLFLACVSKFSEPPTISEVANTIGYSRQNAKRMAAALSERGFVTVMRDRDDARAWRIDLAPSCRGYFEKRYQREIAFLEELFSGFDAEEILGFSKGLARLEQNISAMAAPEQE